MPTYVLAMFLVDEDDAETAKGIVQNSTAFDCIGASPRVLAGGVFATATEAEYLGASCAPPQHDEFAQEIADSLDDYGVTAEDLDDAVHDSKSQEGSRINNADLAGQVEYLLSAGFTELNILDSVWHSSQKQLATLCDECQKVLPRRLAVQRTKADVPVWFCHDCDPEPLPVETDGQEPAAADPAAGHSGRGGVEK